MNSYWFTQENYSTWWAQGPDFSFTALQSVIGTDCSNITTTLWGQSELLTFDITSMQPITAKSFETMINGTRTTVDKTIIWEPVSVTYNPCYPYLSITSKIFTMSPQWSNCVKFMTGLKDPCIYMSTEPGFSAVTPPAYNGLPKSTPHELPSPARASAAPVFQQSTASKTAPPGQSPTALPSEEPTRSVQPPAPLITKLPVVVTMPGTSFTLNSKSALVINSQILTPGGKITISSGNLAGKTVSFAPDGQVLDFDGTSQLLHSSYLIGTQPITAGGAAVTLAGRTYSLVSGGSSIVIDGSTIAVGQATKGDILQQISVPTYIIDGQTLVAGGTAITSSGTVLSLEPDGESVVIGGSTTVDISQLAGASSWVATYFGASPSTEASENYDGLRSTRVTSSGGASQGPTHNSGQEMIKLNCQRVWLGVLFTAIGLGAI